MIGGSRQTNDPIPPSIVERLCDDSIDAIVMEETQHFLVAAPIARATNQQAKKDYPREESSFSAVLFLLKCLPEPGFHLWGSIIVHHPMLSRMAILENLSIVRQNAVRRGNKNRCGSILIDEFKARVRTQ